MQRRPGQAWPIGREPVSGLLGIRIWLSDRTFLGRSMLAHDNWYSETMPPKCELFSRWLISGVLYLIRHERCSTVRGKDSCTLSYKFLEPTVHSTYYYSVCTTATYYLGRYSISDQASMTLLWDLPEKRGQWPSTPDAEQALHWTVRGSNHRLYHKPSYLVLR